MTYEVTTTYGPPVDPTPLNYRFAAVTVIVGFPIFEVAPAPDDVDSHKQTPELVAELQHDQDVGVVLNAITNYTGDLLLLGHSSRPLVLS